MILQPNLSVGLQLQIIRILYRLFHRFFRHAGIAAKRICRDPLLHRLHKRACREENGYMLPFLHNDHPLLSVCRRMLKNKHRHCNRRKLGV